MKYEILPSKFWKKHDYLLYVYDVLRDMLIQADGKKLSDIKIEFKSDKDRLAFENSEDLFVWLDENNYKCESIKLFKSHTFFLLLKDFCYFIYESISSIERGKITVGYSLLRKPVRDNLLYMEWLLAYPEDFHNKMLYADSEEYDLLNWKKFNNESKKDIIYKASNMTHAGDIINHQNIIYDFRFNANEDFSLQNIWNKATHIVTTSKHYKTERNNLNFLYSDNEIWNDYWNYYYTVMPSIMAYVLEISEAHFIETQDIGNVSLLFNRTLRLDKYFNLFDNLYDKQFFEKRYKLLSNIMGDVDNKFKWTCDGCGKEYHFTKELYDFFIENSMFFCEKCNYRNDILKYFVLD